MNIKSQEQFKLSVQEVKDIITKHLMKTGHIKGDVDMSKVQMESITKTHTEPGADPHDSYYYEVFDGIKIRVEHNQ